MQSVACARLHAMKRRLAPTRLPNTCENCVTWSIILYILEQKFLNPLILLAAISFGKFWVRLCLGLFLRDRLQEEISVVSAVTKCFGKSQIESALFLEIAEL